MIICSYYHLLYPLVYSSQKNSVIVEHIITLFTVYVMVIAPPLPLLHISYKYIYISINENL